MGLITEIHKHQVRMAHLMDLKYGMYKLHPCCYDPILGCTGNPGWLEECKTCPFNHSPKESQND